MRVKTKTAQMILQKEKQKQKQRLLVKINSNSNPQMNNISSNKTIKRQQQNIGNRKLATRHLGCYDVYSETIKGEKEHQQQPEKVQQNLLNITNLPQEYCQLQKQNYRLIQANFNMLSKFTSIMDVIRRQLIRVVQFIQQYHYVVAIKTIYHLLDTIRNLNDNNQYIVRQSSKFNGIDSGKNISLNSPSKITINNTKNVIIKQFQPQIQINSDVEQYQYRGTKNTKKLKRKLEISLGVSAVKYTPPEKPKLSINNILEQQSYGESPHLNQDRFRMQKSSVIPSHDKLLNSIEQQGLHSRIESAQDYGKGRKIITQSFYMQIEEKNEEDNQKKSNNQYRNRPYSEKNIKIINNNGKKATIAQNNMQQFYRFLCLQAITIQSYL